MTAGEPRPRLAEAPSSSVWHVGQADRGQASGHIQANSPLDAEWLQGHGIVRAADQGVYVSPYAYRSASRHTGVIAGKRTR